MSEFPPPPPEFDPIVDDAAFGADTPPDEPAGASTSPDAVEKEAPRAGVSATTNIDQLNTQKAEFINFFGEIRAVFQEGESSAARPLSAADASRPKPARQEELTELFAGDDAFIARLLADVEQERIVLLTGDEHSGRATTALYVAIQASRMSASPKPPQVFDVLDRLVEVDLRKLGADKKTFAGCVTVFNDIFRDENRSLTAFFSHATRSTWEELADALRSSGGAIVFTATAQSVARLRQSIDGAIAHHKLPPLTPALIEAGVERKIAFLRRQGRDAAKLGALSRNRAKVIEVHQTLPNVVAFIDEFLRRDVTLEDALKGSADVNTWFLGRVASDVDQWCFALAAVLGQPLRNAKPVPWLDFDRIRRAIADKLTGEDFFPRPANEGATRIAPQPLNDDELERECGIVVEKSTGGAGDVVRFRADQRAAALWTILLTANRRLLTALVPAVRTLAEQDRAAGRVSLRAVAAQTLGRIGEIDPLRLTAPVIQHWAGSANFRPLVGQLLLGVVSSESVAYRDLAFLMVDALVEPLDDLAPREKGVARVRLLTAITAFAQAAMVEPKTALDRLGAIFIQHLAPLVADPNRLAEVRPAPADFTREARLGFLARRISRDYETAILTMEQAIVVLCTNGDLLDAVSAVHDWMSRGGNPTKVLVALLFFIDGIADELEEEEQESPILAALQQRKNGLRDFCAFLGDLCAAIHDPHLLPGSLQSELRERVARLFTRWARRAVGNLAVHGIVEDLFVAFSTVHNEAFRRDVYDFLSVAPFTSDPAMQAFAADVRRRLAAEALQKGVPHAAQLRP